MISALVQRADYPTLRDCVYLNQASLGLIGQPAFTAMSSFLENIARHGNFRMSDADEAVYHDSLRNCAAKLLNSEASRVAVVSGASAILGQLPFLLQPEPGSTVLLISSDFPAITRPWLRQAAENNYSIRFVDDDSATDLTIDLIDAINGDTAVVAVSSVQYATGSVVNIPRLRECTSEAGARLIVDVTQAAGAMRIDAAEWDADVVVASGYKWLGGHGGVALAAMSQNLLKLTPPMTGWMGTPAPFEFDARSDSFADDARRYTQSTMSYVSVAGLTVAMDQLLSMGVEKIEVHAQKLARILISGVSKYGWQPFRSLDDPSASPHIISIAHAVNTTELAAEVLRNHNIICSERGGRIRISLAPYNDESDVNAVIDAIAETNTA